MLLFDLMIIALSRIMYLYTSRVMRKPTFCICENKGADQLRNNCEADRHVCFCFTDSTILLLYIWKITCLYPSSVLVQFGLCWFSHDAAHKLYTYHQQLRSCCCCQLSLPHNFWASLSVRLPVLSANFFL